MSFVESHVELDEDNVGISFVFSRVLWQGHGHKEESIYEHECVLSTNSLESTANILLSRLLKLPCILRAELKSFKYVSTLTVTPDLGFRISSVVDSVNRAVGDVYEVHVETSDTHNLEVLEGVSQVYLVADLLIMTAHDRLSLKV